MLQGSLKRKWLSKIANLSALGCLLDFSLRRFFSRLYFHQRVKLNPHKCLKTNANQKVQQNIVLNLKIDVNWCKMIKDFGVKQILHCFFKNFIISEAIRQLFWYYIWPFLRDLLIRNSKIPHLNKLFNKILFFNTSLIFVFSSSKANTLSKCFLTVNFP